jgi:hypothetical protein
MNVVKFAEYSSRSEKFALTFPPNVKGEEFPRLDIVGSSLCTREGIVLFRRYKSRHAALHLLSQRDAVVGWLKSRGIEAEPSSSGRNAEQVLRSVGDTRMSSLFADEATVRLLDKMAKTIQRDAEGTTAQYPDRTASIKEWKQGGTGHMRPLSLQKARKSLRDSEGSATVRNTHFIASKMAGKTWAPEMARVTGVVWGWATSAACLMVTRSEYVRSFLLGAGERI